MADIRPFRGLRYARQDLTGALCPPYDVIGPEQARRLRRGALNAIHVELPEGSGAAKYARAAGTFKRWRERGVLARDGEPAFYVCEERFRVGGRSLRRAGFLAAMGVSEAAARAVLRHERTLPKPKADRLRLLKAVRANTSPIFGLFPDPSGSLRRVLARARRGKPVASGRTDGGVAYRLWRLADPAQAAALAAGLASKQILIADGHHRFEVGKAYHRMTRSKIADSILTYLCPEEDPGLVVMPTHRIAADAELPRRAERSCRLVACRTQEELLRRLAAARSPYAFGLYDGRYRLAVPRGSGGCRSGLGVEWLAKHLLAGVDPQDLRYAHEAGEARRLARETGAAVVYVKPFPVAAIRRAVRAVGLLPPKSTYFFPKVATGLVFKEV